VLHRFPAAVDVLEVRAGEAADGAVLGPLRDFGDRGEVAFGGDGEAGLDDVDAHLVEEAGDLQLFLVGHGRAGALLAVAEGGVEDDDFILGHDGVLFLAWRGGRWSPLSGRARGHAQRRLRRRRPRGKRGRAVAPREWI
jgi:hypothetical protein